MGIPLRFVRGSFVWKFIPGTTFDNFVDSGTNLHFPFVLPPLSLSSPVCTAGEYLLYRVLLPLLLRPLAGEISDRYGTVTFIIAINYFDHQDKEFDRRFRVFRRQGAVVIVRPCGGERKPVVKDGLEHPASSSSGVVATRALAVGY